MIKNKKNHSVALSNQDVEKLMDSPTQNTLEIGDNCDDEKDDPNRVHLTHFIQPHGVFFVLEEPNFIILQISDNTEAIFGITASSLLGKPLSTLFAKAEIKNLYQNLQDQAIETFSAFTFTSIVKNYGQEFRGFVHRNQQTLILEIEILESQATLDNREENDFYSLIKTSLLRIKRASSFQATLDAIAAEVRHITGFDRVMVYRLDLDNTGVVIAENKREDWESYLDLHYPAVDIPENCRKLYYENWLRTIVDVNRQSVPIIPANHPQTHRRTDLSFSILRSVPDCHLEYLRNMDVAATLCISLINEHQLWGLIVCHHGSPNFVSYEKRKYCELLGQMMSLELIKRQEKEAKRYWAEIKNIQTYLQETLKDLMPLQSIGVSQILKKYSHNILDLVNAQGAVAYFDSELTLLGETPDRQQVQKLLAWFLDFSKQEVFATNSLSKVYPEAITFKNVASGLLGISIFLNQTSYHLLWFRPEIIQTVNWGRDPHETLPDHPQETPRLSPQGSFETWKEIVKATSLPWQILEMEAAKELRTTLMLAALEFSQAALLKANHQLSLLASLDGLTGIANRRRFDEYIMTEWQRAIREQHPLSLILIDVDYFKNYNDTYGHLLGDDCLKKIAEILQKMSQRATDLAARYGGEEFVLVLPNTSQCGAQKVAQRIKAAIADQTIPHKSSSVSEQITLSMGIMTVTPHVMMEMTDFIRRADQALFKAKSEGRDRIVSMDYLEFL